MRVRVIFRGSILFRFEKPEGDSNNRGKVTALLVTHPMDGHDMHMHAGGAMHEHVPRIGIYGRDAVTKRKIVETGIRLETGETKLELRGFGRDGVSTTRGFDSYVPTLGKLRPTGRGRPNRAFYKSWITLPHGRLRARDLVSWDIDANQPAEVAFMGTNFRGFVANEAVLDVGDDSDFEDYKPTKYLAVASTTKRIPKRLWPLTKGTRYVDETDPNTVEILITNYGPQRRRAVFWNLHFQALFDAAGFARNLEYEKSEQYRKFVAAALEFDPYEWNNDFAEMGSGQPFPYVIPESIKPLDGVREDRTPVIIGGAPDDIGVRTKDDGLPKKMVPHDPWSRPICTLAQDDAPFEL